MKNLYVPEDERFETSFRRRFVQSALAFAYERKHTKDEVLTAYLNTVYFGDGAYGAEEAAQTLLRQEREGPRPLGVGDARRFAPRPFDLRDLGG